MENRYSKWPPFTKDFSHILTVQDSIHHYNITECINVPNYFLPAFTSQFVCPRHDPCIFVSPIQEITVNSQTDRFQNFFVDKGQAICTCEKNWLQIKW